jgi:hypothetical protein
MPIYLPRVDHARQKRSFGVVPANGCLVQAAVALAVLKDRGQFGTQAIARSGNPFHRVKGNLRFLLTGLPIMDVPLSICPRILVS